MTAGADRTGPGGAGTNGWPRQRWERALRGRGRRAWTAAVVWPPLTGLVLLAVLRLFGLEGEWAWLVQVVAFTPYLVLGGLLLAVLAGVTRRGTAAVIAALATLALAVAVLPRAVRDPAAEGGVPLVVMSMNMRLGGADAHSIVELVRSAGVDVLAVQEFTPEAERNLEVAGIAELLPYRESHPEPGASGSGLFSRLPLTDGGVRSVSLSPPLGAAARGSGLGFAQAYASITPVAGRTVVVESVHPAPPLDPHAWAAGLRDQVPAGEEHILAGDFNATLDHAALRDLIATGYHDAAAQVGQGLTPTWPYYGRRSAVTPKITIDHVLMPPGVGALGFRAVTIPRTDHRAIVANLVILLR